jgi:uncharacterized damage-inducible protein DinB
MTGMPNVDSSLLLAHIEYATWALGRAFALIDTLPPEAIAQPPANACRSVLATLRHLYETDWYYFVHLKGGATRAEVREGAVHIPDCKAPEEYAALKQEYLTLRRAIHEWAQEEMPARKDAVLQGWGAWPAWQVVMHMANHTTHHLGQISTLLREAGCVCGPEHWTDLIMYYQQKFPPDA